MAFMFSLAVMAAVCMVDTTSTVVRWPSSIMRCSFTRMIMLSRFCSSCSSSFFFLRHCSACAARATQGGEHAWRGLASWHSVDGAVTRWVATAPSHALPACTTGRNSAGVTAVPQGIPPQPMCVGFDPERAAHASGNPNGNGVTRTCAFFFSRVNSLAFSSSASMRFSTRDLRFSKDSSWSVRFWIAEIVLFAAFVLACCVGCVGAAAAAGLPPNSFLNLHTGEAKDTVRRKVAGRPDEGATTQVQGAGTAMAWLCTNLPQPCAKAPMMMSSGKWPSHHMSPLARLEQEDARPSSSPS